MDKWTSTLQKWKAETENRNRKKLPAR